MAIKLGFESQKPKKEKVTVVKDEARELVSIVHTAINSDLYMPSLTQKFDKDTEEIVLERHEIITMLQDELKKNHIPYDLGLRIIEDGENRVLQAVIASDIFATVADQENFAHMSNYLEDGEFVIEFSEFDADGNANFLTEDDAPIEYWLSKASEWDVQTLPALKTAIGTVGKVKLCAHFTNEGLNFETFTNRYLTDKGVAGCTDKKVKGFSLQ
jgi:hypothetical protein